MTINNEYEGFEVDMSVKINEHLANLDRINYQVAELLRIKAEIEKLVILETGRGEFDGSGNLIKITKEGRHQHLIGKYKIKIKTDLLYKVNKEEYEIIKNSLREEFNPIKTSISYRVDKKTLASIDLYGSEEDKKLIDKFISFDFAKPNVTLEVNA
jgi:hypothetical protein